MEILLWRYRYRCEVSSARDFIMTTFDTIIVYRALFLLHGHLQTLPVSGTFIEWLRRVSQAGLRFATNLMVDVAHDHLQRVTPTNTAILPISCAYNLHAAIKHTKIQEAEGNLYNARVLRENRETLQALSDTCYKRWRMCF